MSLSICNRYYTINYGVVAVLVSSTETSDRRLTQTPLQLLHRSVSALPTAKFFHSGE
jgi:hypothetical protein